MRAPASATQLIASFGWDSDDTLTQQDCGELVTVLLDTLEEAMKGSEAEGEVSRLFSLSCVYEDRIHKPSSEGMQGWAARRDDPAHWPLTLHHIKECEGVPDALDKMMEVEVRRASPAVAQSAATLQDQIISSNVAEQSRATSSDARAGGAGDRGLQPCLTQEDLS